MASLEHFKSDILPRIVRSGCFGEGAELIRITEDSGLAKDQFASAVRFLDIELTCNTIVKKFSLVCKFQCSSAEIRERFQTDSQFFNETLVYKEIVPLFPRSVVELLPAFYYGAALNASLEEDVIVVANLTPRGYRQSDARIFLDFEHCLLAFQKLGKFHGASLLIKEKHTLKFANKINELLETRWLDKFKTYNNQYFGENAKRGIIPIIKNGEDLDVLNQFLNRLNDVHSLMKDIFNVNETSLLCHGDFCRNNMMFKYEDDRPVDVKFYDLATARYASPIVDISCFLFLNVDPELRQKHLKTDFLRVYFEALKNIAGSQAPTMAELWKEFQQKAVYGYILASFFLPVMIEPRPNMEQRLTDKSLEENVKSSLFRGGEEVTKVLSDSVKDLLTWGCLK